MNDCTRCGHPKTDHHGTMCDAILHYVQHYRPEYCQCRGYQSREAEQ